MASSTPSIAPSVDTYRIPRTSPWAKAWQTTAALSAVGALLCIFAYFGDSARTQFSYLFAFICALALALGSLFFVIVQHLTGAGWSVTLRRTAELYASGIWVFPILFLPILAGVVSGSSALYPWLHVDAEGAHQQHESGAAHDAEHHSALPGLFESTAVAQHEEDEAAPSHQTPLHHAHEDVIRAKLGFLRGPSWLFPEYAGFFALRAILYFVVWFSIMRFFVRNSTNQDRTRDIATTKKMQTRAAVCMIGFALSLTFAAFDWMMSLEPTWFSTIFGVQYFTVGAVVALATLVVTTLAFSEAGLTGKAIHQQHFHDLGKLLFGFMVFWAYI